MVKARINNCGECYDDENFIIGDPIYEELCYFERFIPDDVRKDMMDE